MQIYAEFKQQGGGVEMEGRGKAVGEIHSKCIECLHIAYFPVTHCLKNFPELHIFRTTENNV